MLSKISLNGTTKNCSNKKKNVTLFTIIVSTTNNNLCTISITCTLKLKKMDYKVKKKSCLSISLAWEKISSYN